jgi:hypothetical protein
VRGRSEGPRGRSGNFDAAGIALPRAAGTSRGGRLAALRGVLEGVFDQDADRFCSGWLGVRPSPEVAAAQGFLSHFRYTSSRHDLRVGDAEVKISKVREPVIHGGRVPWIKVGRSSRAKRTAGINHRFARNRIRSVRFVVAVRPMVRQRRSREHRSDRDQPRKYDNFFTHPCSPLRSELLYCATAPTPVFNRAFTPLRSKYLRATIRRNAKRGSCLAAPFSFGPCPSLGVGAVAGHVAASRITVSGDAARSVQNCTLSGLE